MDGLCYRDASSKTIVLEGCISECIRIIVLERCISQCFRIIVLERCISQCIRIIVLERCIELLYWKDASLNTLDYCIFW